MQSSCLDGESSTRLNYSCTRYWKLGLISGMMFLQCVVGVSSGTSPSKKHCNLSVSIQNGSDVWVPIWNG